MDSPKHDIEAPPSYVPQPVFHPPIYWTGPTNVVLRVLQAVFTLIAFSVMADVVHDAFYTVQAFSYLLAVNVIAFVYALGQLSFAFWTMKSGGIWKAPRNVYHFFTFGADQVMAYFLVSGGSAAAAFITGNCPSFQNFCSRISGSIVFDFLGFIAFCCASILTGFHLVKCILKT